MSGRWVGNRGLLTLSLRQKLLHFPTGYLPADTWQSSLIPCSVFLLLSFPWQPLIGSGLHRRQFGCHHKRVSSIPPKNGTPVLCGGDAAAPHFARRPSTLWASGMTSCSASICTPIAPSVCLAPVKQSRRMPSSFLPFHPMFWHCVHMAPGGILMDAFLPSITVILTSFNNPLTKRIKVLLTFTCFPCL